MMRRIVGASLASRRIVLLVALALGLLGAWQYSNMSVDVVPEFTPPTVSVQTEALGLSAAEVEQMITVPLEQDLLNGVAYLDTIRSESVPGLSSIEMIFEKGTTLLKARQVVAERLTQAHALPQVSKPPQMLQPLSSTSRVMMVGFSSKTVSAIDLSVLAWWTIRPKLMGVPGVANVSIFGQRDQQLQVQIDPAKLKERGVSLDEVIRTTGNALWVSPLTFLEASTPGAGGFIDTANQRLGIQHLSPINTPADLAKVAMDTDDSRRLVLGDIANVVSDHQPLIGDAVFTDGPGVLLVIERFPDTPISGVTKGIDEALADMRPGLDGIEVDPFLFRPQAYVNEAVDNLTTVLIVGAIVGLVLLAGLFLDWRSALTSALAILGAVAVGWFVLFALDVTINSMVVAGLVLGLLIVVDDAVLGTSSLLTRLRTAEPETWDRKGNSNGEQTRITTLIRDVTIELRTPLLYGTVIIFVTLVPLFFMDGLSADSFLPPVALAYGLAVLSALVVALALVPALGLVLLSRGAAAPKQTALERWIERGYSRIGASIVAKPLVGAVAAVVALAVGVGVVTQLDANTVPSFKENDLVINWQAAPATSITEMQRITTLVNNELRGVPGVRKVASHVGRAITSDQLQTVSGGQLWVHVDPSADYGATRQQIEAVLLSYPGMRAELSTYTSQRLNAVVASDEEPVNVRIFGDDVQVLSEKAAEVDAMLQTVTGVTDIRVDAPVLEPTLAVKVDLAAAEKSGIKPGDVRRAAATLLQGIAVGSLFEQQKVFEVVVKGTPETRHSLTSIRELLIDSPSGEWVRLGDVADVALSQTPVAIHREASSRALDVVARISGRDRGAVRSEINEKLRAIKFPLSHHAELQGGFEDRKTAESRVWKLSLAAAIGVLLLLQASFASWRLAFMVLAILPLGVVGGLVTAAIDGDTLTLGSIAGLLGVLGLTARRSVLLVHRYDDPGREWPDEVRLAVVLAATRQQVVPTVLAGITTAGVFAPLLFLGDLPGGEIVRPLAVVVLGGLVTSALVTLLVLPSLYTWLLSHKQAKSDVVDDTDETVTSVTVGE